MFRERGARDYHRCQKSVQALGNLMNEVVVPGYDLLSLLYRPQGWASNDHFERMRLKFKRGDYSEITAPSANSPKKIRMAGFVYSYERTIGQNHISFQKVIYRKAIFP